MDKRVLTVKLESAGKVLELGGAESVYKISDIKGLESTDYELSFADNAQLPGSTIVGQRAGNRSIIIKFDLPDSADFSEHRHNIIRFFRPDTKGSMTVNYNGLQRKIDYAVENFKFENSNLYEKLRVNVSFVCPQPFFMNLDNYGKNIASLTPLFSFPLFLPRQGRPMSYKTMKQNVNLPNDGDVDTGIEIIFKAVRGTVLNPKLEKVSTGEYMRVILNMAQGDILRISTNPGSKRVELNGANIFQRIDRNSSFFSITVGDNILKYSADDNYTNLDVTLYYVPKYLGL